MWYLKVSPDLFIAVALICMIQNAISIPIDPSATEDKWDILAKSTDYKDLKKLTGMCKKSINNFNEKLENMKSSTNIKLSESNKTTADIVSLAKDVKSQVKSASNSIVSIRIMVQKMALRFRDTFKSLESFSDIDHELIFEKLKVIEKTTVDYKKPLVRNAIRSFGNKYDLGELANKILKTTLDDEKLKDSYDSKRKIAKQEFSLLWNTLKRHSKTINNDALETLNIFINGVDSVKTIKIQAKNYEEDALNEEKGGEHIKNLKNAVELAKAFKLNFKDEFELGSDELTYSQEEKNELKNKLNEEQPDDTLNNSKLQISGEDLTNSLKSEEKNSNETINNDMDTTEPNNEDVKQYPKDNSSNSNSVNSPIEQKLPNVENKYNDEVNNIQPEGQNIKQDLTDNSSNSNSANTPNEEKLPYEETINNDEVNIPQPVKSDSSVNNSNSSTEGNQDSQNTPNVDDSDEEMVTQLKNQEVKPTPKDDISKLNRKNSPNDKDIEMQQNEPAKNQRMTRKIMNKKREKIPVLPWTELIKQKDLKVSNQSQKCKSRIQNTLKELDNMRTPVKNTIRNVKNYDELEKSKANIIQQFGDKMIETSTKLADNLINAADDVCLKVMPMNKRYETKFKNDPNINRIEYLLSKNYDPNQYILNVLKNTKSASDEPQKESYNKMLSLSYNLQNETKEIEKAALYAMNKINEGKLAATDLKKMFNKEKASKACYIQKMLQEKENEEEKKQKEDIKNKIKEYMTEKTPNKQIDPNSNLDLVEATNKYLVEDAEETQIIDDDDQTKSSEILDDKNNNKTDIIEETKQQENEPQTANYKTPMKNPTNESEDSKIQEEADEQPKAVPEIPKGNNVSRDLPETLNPENNPDTINETKETEGNSTIEDQNPNITANPNADDKTPIDKKPVKRVRKIKKPKVGDEDTVEYEESEEVPEDESDDSGIHAEHDKTEPEGPKENNVVRDLPETLNPENKPDTINETKETEGDTSIEDQNPIITANPNVDDKTPIDKKPVRRVRKVKKPKVGDEDTVEYEESEEVPEDESDDSGVHEEHDKTEPEVPKENNVVRDLPESLNPENKPDTINETKETEGDTSIEDQNPIITANPNVDDKTPIDKKPVRRVRKIKKPKVGDEDTVEYEESEEVPDDESDDSGVHEEHDKTEPEVPKENSVARDLPETLNPENKPDTINETKETEGDTSIEDQNPIITVNPNVDDKTPIDKKPVRRVRKVKKPKVGDEDTVEYEESEEVPDDESNDSGVHEEHDKTEPEIPKENNVVIDLPETLNPENKPDTINETKETEGDTSIEDHNPNITANPNVDDKKPIDKKPVRRVRKIKKPKVGDEDTVEYEESEEVPEDESDDSGIYEEHDKTEPEIPKENNVVRDLPETLNPENKPDTINETKETEGDTSIEDHNPNITANPNVDDKKPIDKKPVRRVRKIKKPKAGDEDTVEYEESEEVPDDESDDSGVHEEHDKTEPEVPKENNVARDLPETLNPENKPDTINETKETEGDTSIEDQNPIITANPNVDDKTPIDKKPVRRVRKIKKPKVGDEDTVEYEESEEVPDDESDDSGVHEEHDKTEPEVPKENSVARDLPETLNPENKPDTINETKETEGDTSIEDQNPIITVNPNVDDKTPIDKKPVRRVRKVKKPKVGDEDTVEYEESEEVPEDESDDSGIHEEHDKTEPEIPKENNVVRDLPETLNPENKPDTINETKETEGDTSIEDQNPIITANPNVDDKKPIDKKPVRRVRKIKKPKVGDEDTVEYEESEEVPDDESDDSGVHEEHDKTEPEVPKENNVARDLPETLNPENKPDTINETKETEGDTSIEDQNPNITANPNVDDKKPIDKKPVRRVRKIKKPKVGDEDTVEYEESEEVPDDESDDSGVHEEHDKTEPEVPKENNVARDLPETLNPENKPDTINETKETEGDTSIEDQNPIITANPNVDDKTPIDKKPVRRVRKIKKPKVGDEDTVEYEESEEVPDDESNDSGVHEEHDKTEPEVPKENNVVRDLPESLNPETKPDTINETKETEGDTSIEDQNPIITANPNVDDKTPIDKKPVRRVRKIKKPKVGDEDTVEYEESEEVPEDESDDSGIHEEHDKTEPEIPKENNVVRDLPETLNPENKPDTINETNETEGDTSIEDQNPNITANPNADDKTPIDKKPVRRVRKIKEPKVGDEDTVEYEESEEVPDDESDVLGIYNEAKDEPKTELENPNIDDKIPLKKKPHWFMPNWHARKVLKPNGADDELEEYEETEDVFDEEAVDSRINEEDDEKSKNELQIPNDFNVSRNSSPTDDTDFESGDANSDSDDKIPQKNKPVYRFKNNNKTDECDDVSEEYDETDEVFDDEPDQSRLLKESGGKLNSEPQILNESNVPRDLSEVNEVGIAANDIDDPNLLEGDSTSDDSDPNISSNLESGDKIPQKNKPVKRGKNGIKPDESDDVSEEYDESNEVPDENFDDFDKPNVSDKSPKSKDNMPNTSVEPDDNNTPEVKKIINRVKKNISSDEPNDETDDYNETDVIPDDVDLESDGLDHSDIPEDENLPKNNASRNISPSDEDTDQKINVNNNEMALDKWSEVESLPNLSDNHTSDESFNHDVKNIPRASDEVTNDDSGTSQEILDDYNYEHDVDSNDNITNDKLPSKPHKYYEEPDELYDENNPYDDHEDVQKRDNKELLENSQSNGIEPSEESKYPETSDLSSENVLHPHDINRQGKPIESSQHKNKKKPRFTRKPKNDNKQPNESEIDDDIDDVATDIQDENDETMPDDDQEELQENDIAEPLESPEINEMEYDRESDLPDDFESPSEFEPSQNDKDEINYEDSEEKENLNTNKGKKYKKKKLIRKRKSTTSNNTNKIRTITEENISETLQKKKNNRKNEDYSPENLEEEKSKDIKPKQKKKKRVKRVKRYLVNKATNERIPIDDDMETNQWPMTSENPKFFDAENEPENSNLDDSIMEKDNNDYSAFLFNENNTDQCKREAYDKFKKVKSEDTKEIAYRSILDTSEMRSNVLITIKNAIKNVKYAKTSKDVDQNLGTVSYVLKTGLKQTILDLMEKVLPLTNNFLQTTKSLKELYVKGPPTTHKMLSSILQSEPNIPSIDNGILRFISPKFNVDELIDGLFKEPLYTKPLKNKKSIAQRKFMELSKNMETAVSNIDCYVLSAMSTIGIGSNALISLKSGRMIMSEKHPRTKALRDAIGVVKSLQKVLGNSEFTPKINNDNTIENKDDDDDDDDEDPEQVAKKNEEYLKTVPTLDDTVPLFKKEPNKRRSLGVIVVHPNKEVEYKEVTDTSELKKFVGDRTNKYTNQSQNNRPKFLKVDKKKLIDKIVADVKKKADKNGMSKKEMVDEIVNTLKKK